MHRANAPQGAGASRGHESRACEGRIDYAVRLTRKKKEKAPPPPAPPPAARPKAAAAARPELPAMPKKPQHPSKPIFTASAPRPAPPEPAAVPSGPREVPGAEWAPARGQRAAAAAPPPQPALPVLRPPQPAPPAQRPRSNDADFEASWGHLAPPAAFEAPPTPPPWHVAGNSAAAALPAQVKTELDSCVAAGVFAAADIDEGAAATLLRGGAELALLVLGQLESGTGARAGALIAQHSAQLAALVAPATPQQPPPQQRFDLPPATPMRFDLPPAPPMMPPPSLFDAGSFLPPPPQQQQQQQESVLPPLPWLMAPAAVPLPMPEPAAPVSLLPPLPPPRAPREYRPTAHEAAEPDRASSAHALEVAQLRAELEAARAEAAQLRAVVAYQRDELARLQGPS